MLTIEQTNYSLTFNYSNHMPEIVFISNKELTGTDYILHTGGNQEVFRAFKFLEAEDMEDFLKKYNLLNDCAIVDGYNILICYVGTLAKFSTAPTLGHNIPEATKNLFNNIKSFYEIERIKGNETRNKKFARN